MNTNNETHEELIILVSAIFSMISSIMSILATATSGWQIDGYHNKTGLFQTCYKDYCTSVTEKHIISIVLSIISQCLLLFGIISSFINTFIHRYRRILIMINILFFLASLFLWLTIMTISLNLFMNGGSVIIFNAAIAFSLLSTFTASYALGASLASRQTHIQSEISVIPVQYNQTILSSDLQLNMQPLSQKN